MESYLMQLTSIVLKLPPGWSVGTKPVGQNDVFTKRRKCYANKLAVIIMRLVVSCYNKWQKGGLLLENNKMLVKGYIFSALWFLVLWCNISALSFLLFQHNGFGPLTQTHFKFDW